MKIRGSMALYVATVLMLTTVMVIAMGSVIEAMVARMYVSARLAEASMERLAVVTVGNNTVIINPSSRSIKLLGVICPDGYKYIGMVLEPYEAVVVPETGCVAVTGYGNVFANGSPTDLSVVKKVVDYRGNEVRMDEVRVSFHVDDEYTVTLGGETPCVTVGVANDNKVAVPVTMNATLVGYSTVLQFSVSPQQETYVELPVLRMVSSEGVLTTDVSIFIDVFGSSTSTKKSVVVYVVKPDIFVDVVKQPTIVYGTYVSTIPGEMVIYNMGPNTIVAWWLSSTVTIAPLSYVSANIVDDVRVLWIENVGGKNVTLSTTVDVEPVYMVPETR